MQPGVAPMPPAQAPGQQIPGMYPQPGVNAPLNAVPPGMQQQFAVIHAAAMSQLQPGMQPQPEGQTLKMFRSQSELEGALAAAVAQQQPGKVLGCMFVEVWWSLLVISV